MNLIRSAVTAATVLGLTLAVAGCGDDSEKVADKSPTSAGSSSSASAKPGSYPTYAPADYHYRLRILCYCPLVGPVDVTVRGGKVAAATIASGPHKGQQAPTYARKTINDLIAVANDPKSGKVEVDWPQGTAAPRKIDVDPLRHATDSGTTYLIRDLQQD